MNLEESFQRAGKGNGILNAGIHALATGGTVNMCGIASQQDSALPQNFGHAVLNLKS
jgi:hypothetical protein